jgi:hypothetical protein
LFEKYLLMNPNEKRKKKNWMIGPWLGLERLYSRMVLFSCRRLWALRRFCWYGRMVLSKKIGPYLQLGLERLYSRMVLSSRRHVWALRIGLLVQEKCCCPSLGHDWAFVGTAGWCCPNLGRGWALRDYTAGWCCLLAAMFEL